MSSRILKYQLPLPAAVEMPKGAWIIDFQFQAGKPTIWVIAATDKKMQKRQFVILPTGAEVLPNAHYIKTAHLVEHGEVWHLFEVEED